MPTPEEIAAQEAAAAEALAAEEAAKAAAQEDAGDNGDNEAKGEEEGTEEAALEPIDLKPAIAAVQETLQEKAEKIEQMREDNIFLSKQIASPDREQFNKGGVYEDLPQLFIGEHPIYLYTEQQLSSIIADSNFTDSEKRDKLRTIDKAMAVYEDRKKQYQKQISQNMTSANQQEWQQVELGFTDPKTGIKGIDKYVKEIWQYCEEQMAASPATKAKCESSLDEKFKLAVRAIRDLKIDQKLNKALSGEDRPGLEVPLGGTQSRGTKRGAQPAPSFTQKQLAEYARTPGKVDDKLLAQINAAVAAGRIKP